MKELEISARTVDEAVAEALKQLGASHDQVEVEVLKKGRAGIFGMGSEEARVRVSLRTQLDDRPAVAVPEAEAQPEAKPRVTAAADAAQIATEALTNLLRLMKLDATVKATKPTPEAALALNIEGQDLGVLIGRRGQTLTSLQHIVRLIVSERLKKWTPLAIDVSGYKENRRVALQKLALNFAEQVKATKRPVTMEPMPADERRIVHLALADDVDVTTQRIGEGEERKVVIQLKTR